MGIILYYFMESIMSQYYLVYLLLQPDKSTTSSYLLFLQLQSQADLQIDFQQIKVFEDIHYKV